MSDPNDPRPIRVFVFPDRPDVLLVYVPEGQELWLPRLATPFQRYDVAKKLGDADIPATVRESVAGRFTKAMELSKNADEATRVQRQREDEAARHIRIKFDDEATTYEKKRSSLILAKNEIDEEIRNLKIDVGKAMSYASTTGRYAPAADFRGKQARISDLQTTSLAIQRRLGELKRQQREERERQQPERIKRFLSRARAKLGDHTMTPTAPAPRRMKGRR